MTKNIITNNISHQENPKCYITTEQYNNQGSKTIYIAEENAKNLKEAGENLDVLETMHKKKLPEKLYKSLHNWITEAGENEKPLREEAAYRIEDAIVGFDKKLSLSGLGLSTIPKIEGLDIFFRYLRVLDLSRNQLETLDPEISTLQFLEELNLSDNKIKVFPLYLTNLGGLKLLNLNNNLIEEFNIPNFRIFKELKELHLKNNKLEDILSFKQKVEISNIPKLEYLDLGGNKIENIEEIKKLLSKVQNLTLVLDNNPLKINKEKFVSNTNQLKWLQNNLLNGCQLHINEDCISQESLEMTLENQENKSLGKSTDNQSSYEDDGNDKNSRESQPKSSSKSTAENVLSSQKKEAKGNSITNH